MIAIQSIHIIYADTDGKMLIAGQDININKDSIVKKFETTRRLCIGLKSSRSFDDVGL